MGRQDPSEDIHNTYDWQKKKNVHRIYSVFLELCNKKANGTTENM